MLRSLLSNNALLLFQYSVTALVSLLLIPHIVRTIGLERFGELAIALACANYGAVVVQYAFHLSGPRQIANLAPGETDADIVSRALASKICLLGIVILLVACGSIVSSWFGYRVSLAQLLLMTSVPAGAALNTVWHLYAVGRFQYASLLSIVGASVSLAVGFFSVRNASAESLFAAAAALAVGHLIVGVGTLLTSMRLLVAKAQRLMWRHPWIELRAGWPLFSSQFAAALYAASGPLAVAVLAGAGEAGAYAATERIANAVAGACLLTHTAAYPMLAKAYSEDRGAYLRLLRTVLAIYAAGAGAVVLAAIVLRDVVLAFMLGSAGTDYGLLLLLAAAWVILAIFGTALTGYLTVSGQSHRVLPLTLKVLCLSFLIGVPATAVWGASGWMAALCLAQAPVLLMAWHAWRSESQLVNERAVS